MRKFTVRHTIDCTPDRFWEAVLWDPAFNQALYGDLLGYGYAIRKNDPEGGVREATITPKVDLPGPIKRVIGESIGFDENGTMQGSGDTRKYTFHVVPHTFANKISVNGFMEVPPAGEGKCTRIVHFEVGCTIFGIGKLVETFASKEIERSYDQSAEFTNTYLKRQG
ncbi:MAG: DUF2505 family protein [Myxococcota bacterium]